MAVTGLIIFFVLASFLLHSYGITGLFSTGGTTFALSSALLWLVVGLWMAFRYFSLRAKERK